MNLKEKVHAIFQNLKPFQQCTKKFASVRFQSAHPFQEPSFVRVLHDASREGLREKQK